MRDTHRPISGKIAAQPRHDGFVYVTILVAAVIAAAFSLHDAPQFLGNPFSPAALLSAGK